MAGEERLSGRNVAAFLNVNGQIGFAKSIKKSGGKPKQKEITDGTSEVIMEQDSRREPVEYDVVLMLPRVGYQAYADNFRAGTDVTSFQNGVDSVTYLQDFGAFRIVDDSWEAPIFEDDIVTVTIKIRSYGYGTGTDFTP